MQGYGSLGRAGASLKQVRNRSKQVSGESKTSLGQVPNLPETYSDLPETCAELLRALASSSREAPRAILRRPLLLFLANGLAHEPAAEIIGIEIEMGTDTFEGI